MATYIMMGNYTSEAIKEMNPDRTDKTIHLIKECGGEVKLIYALLGGYDLLLITELPNNEMAMKASLGLNLLTGISFKTFPAVAVSDFDNLIGDVAA